MIGAPIGEAIGAPIREVVVVPGQVGEYLGLHGVHRGFQGIMASQLNGVLQG